MYYSDDVIEEVKSRTDIVDIIGNYVHLKRKGNNYFGLCPFHNEKTSSFSVSVEKQMFYCFGCGKGGSVFTFLMEHENFTYPESIEYLAEQANVELPKEELTDEQRKIADYRAVLRDMNRDAANYFYRMLHHEHGKKGLDYLQSRQLSDDTITKFGLGFADIYRDDLYRYLRKKGYTDDQLKDSGLVEIDAQGGYDKFWNRVIFPIVDMNGKVIAFGGRVMGDGEPKYLNSKETMLFEKKRNLYGLHLARRTKRDGFILCEGYMDVISMHQAGFDNALASLGTAYTVEQAQLIKRYQNNVYLAYDSDGAGQKAALRAIEICRSVGLPSRVIQMKPFKDPDEFIKNLGSQEFETRIEQAISGTMFEIQVLAEQYNMSDPQSLSEFQTEMAKILAKISDKMTRENFVQAAAREYSANFEALLGKVNSIGEMQEQRKRFETIQEEDRRAHRKTNEHAEQGLVRQEKLLLTWIANKPKIWGAISEHIDVDDFSEGLTKQLAQVFGKHVELYGEVKPNKILDAFDDVSQHGKVSEILNNEITYYGSDSDDENMRREFEYKAITETVRRVKEASIKRQMKDLEELHVSSDEKGVRLLKLIEQQKKLKSLHITFHNG